MGLHVARLSALVRTGFALLLPIGQTLGAEVPSAVSTFLRILRNLQTNGAEHILQCRLTRYCVTGTDGELRQVVLEVIKSNDSLLLHFNIFKQDP